MIANPELRALRSDDSPQCDAQVAMIRTMDNWRARPEIASLLGELEEFSAGAELERCPRLAALFTPGEAAAREMAAGFSAMTCSALSAWPLGHVALRHFTDGVTSTVLIARAVNVTLSLVAIDGDGLGFRPESATASFGPNQTWEHVLGGSAGVELIECKPTGPRTARLSRRKMDIGQGTVQFRDGKRDARLLHRIDGALVSLRLQRRRPNAEATREYDLASGALLHQAAGNPRDSRLELMIAMLGRMERKDAAPLIAELACGEASAALRWQALRECLALDTQIGFTALAAIAARADDPLSGPAGALRAQLLEAHPQLQEVEPCPV
ncbi:MAG: hypothetical protein ABIM50_04825 [Novosphingobium sp.]